jgi:uncharacterized protein
MRGISRTDVIITDPFWAHRQTLNKSSALSYQWEQYEKAGTIDNFRIVSGTSQGIRRGFFYTDSDLHKWSDAVSRILQPGEKGDLADKLREYIQLMKKAMDSDGYLYTYNQFHFPGTRWKNLPIEHELYCMGHFIEAGVELYNSTRRKDLLELVTLTANRICEDFANAGPSGTPGHQQIELALIKLFRITGNVTYLATAQRFIEKRGRMLFPGIALLRSFVSHSRRTSIVSKQKAGTDESGAGFDFSETFQTVEPPFIGLRSFLSFISGKYQQQHAPLSKQLSPEGHSVRWAYYMTAAAMLYRENNDSTILDAIRIAWEQCVDTKMYVTGGIGSLPVIEGFGKPYELPDEYAYCETCAAIGNIFFNHEMLHATTDTRYADLMEWQLYNAASVGISLEGNAYFYRNPMKSDGTLQRHSWFNTACCPSNISRLWADIGSYIYSSDENDIWINQYISSTTGMIEKGISVSVKSEFPWEGNVFIEATSNSNREIRLHLRIPSWAGEAVIKVNGKEMYRETRDSVDTFGLSFFNRSTWFTVGIPALKTIEVECSFPMVIEKIHSHKKVSGKGNKAAFYRGPLVYCFESVDNPAIRPDTVRVQQDTIHYHYNPDILGGTGTIGLTDENGEWFRLVPYFLWGNRGPSKMRVWLPDPYISSSTSLKGNAAHE